MRTYTLRFGDAVAEVVPERGGLITRFALGGDEILYLDRATLEDTTKNVRGGIPILFPWAGRPRPDMRQHGFARQMPFVVTAAGETELTMELASSMETRTLFDFDFLLQLRVRLASQSLTLLIDVHNNGQRPMPLHFGLHPYFRVPVEAKSAARVESGARRAFDNRTGKFGQYEAPNFGEGETDLHLLDHGTHQTILSAPGLSDRVLAWDRFLPRLVVWTQPGKPFVCVEPWSALAAEYPGAAGAASTNAISEEMGPQPVRPAFLAPGGHDGGAFTVSVSS